MKFIVTGDWHLDNRSPENRTDNYFETQAGKVDFVIDQGSFPILQPGDFFNSYKANDFLKQFYIKKLQEEKIYTVFGQHDLRFHSSDKKNTPLRVLEASGVVQIATEEALLLKNHAIYGCSWGEEFPEIEDEKEFNILLLHKLVTCDDSFSWESDDWIHAKNLFRLTQFDLIVSGDNHKTFIAEKEGKKGKRFVINCGSLMRSTIDQQDHEPHIYLFDTKERTAEKILIPVRPFLEVINLEKSKKIKSRDEKLEAFVQKLKDLRLEGIDFEKNVQLYFQEHKKEIEPEVIQFVERMLS